MLSRLSRSLFVVLSMVAILASTAGIAMAQPTNDDIGSATVISELPFIDTLDTTEGTVGSEEGCFGDAATVWYAYTAPEDTTLYVDTRGSDYDTTLTAYMGSPDALEMIDCNDDFFGVQSFLTVDVQAGTTYWLMAGSCCEGPGGILNLTVGEDPPPLPPEPEISITLDDTGSFDPRTGTATISGTVTCTGGDFVDLEGFLRQRWGRQFIVGAEFSSLTCDGTSTWSLEIRGSGVFAGGRAQAQVGVWTCNEFFCAFAHDEQEVRLTGGRR